MYHVGAVLVKGSVLARKSNMPTREGMAGVCAEEALLRHPPKKGRIGSKVYVARVTKQGEVTMAKPCKKCQLILKNKKVKKVFYTDWEGKWQELSLD